MPRIARIIAVGCPHHISQRGNYKQEIFSDEFDRKEYLNYIAEEIQKYKVQVLAYCLMKNHVHFIAVPEEETSIGNVFKYANMRYSLEEDETDIKEIKQRTRNGRPMASIELMRKMEDNLNRKLLEKPRGRPRIKNK